MKEKGLFEEKNTLVTGLDKIKCLKQIKYQLLIITCAPTSDLPSDINIMFYNVNCFIRIMDKVFGQWKCNSFEIFFKN